MKQDKSKGMGQHYEEGQQFTLVSLTFELTEKTTLGEMRKADKVKLIPKGITLIPVKSTKELRFK